MNMYDKPTLVKVLKKDNTYKVIYIVNKSYKRKLFDSLLDAIDFACKFANRDDVLLSISI